MYHVDKYRMAAKREAEARGLLGDKKANRGKTQMQVKEEEKVVLFDCTAVLTLYSGHNYANYRRKSRHTRRVSETRVD